MVETIRLAPHDPLPDEGRHVLVLRRLGEDDPGVVVTELVAYGAHGGSTPAVTPDGHAMELDAAVRAAEALAGRHGLPRVYVVDRTAGKLEQEALAGHGARDFTGDALDDTDTDTGQGSDIRDRPHDAGFMR